MQETKELEVTKEEIIVIGFNYLDILFALGGSLLKYKKQQNKVHLIIVENFSCGNKTTTIENEQFCEKNSSGKKTTKIDSDASNELSLETKSKLANTQDFVLEKLLNKQIVSSINHLYLDSQETLSSLVENLNNEPDTSSENFKYFVPSVFKHSLNKEIQFLFQEFSKYLQDKGDEQIFYDMNSSRDFSTHESNTLIVDISQFWEEKKSLLEELLGFENNGYKAREIKQCQALNQFQAYEFSQQFEAVEVFYSNSKSIDSSSELPLVSIIIRTKDRPKFLHRAIAAVVSQNYQRIELIIVNDGGAELEFDLSQLNGKLEAYQLLSLKQNQGRAGAANAGLEAVTGDYALFLDDDDTIEPSHIQSLVRASIKHCVDVAYSSVKSDPEGAVYDTPYNRYQLYAGNYIPIHAVLFSSKFIAQGCRFDKQFKIYEDWDFWINLAQYCDFFHLDIISATYHMAGNSGGGNNADLALDQKYRLKLYKKWEQLWGEENLNKIFLSMHKELASYRQKLFVLKAEDEQTKHHVENISQQNQELRVAAKDSESHIKNLERQINEQTKSLDERLIHSNNLEHQIAQLQNVINLKENNERNLEKVVNDQQESLESQNAKIASLTQEHNDLATQLHHSHLMLAEKDKSIQAMDEAGKQQSEKVLALQNELNLVYGSISWRISKPLRTIKKLIN